LGSNVQEEKIKDDSIKNLATKKDTPSVVVDESQQQIKNENNGAPSMTKEDAIEKVAA